MAPGRLGLLAFADNGRVWANGERSRRWHQGYGGGVWLVLFDRFAMTGTLGLSEEETAFAL